MSTELGRVAEWSRVLIQYIDGGVAEWRRVPTEFGRVEK